LSFGVVIDAQAAGDLAVLEARGRRAVRVHLGADVAAGLKALARPSMKGWNRVREQGSGTREQKPGTGSVREPVPRFFYGFAGGLGGSVRYSSPVRARSRARRSESSFRRVVSSMNSFFCSSVRGGAGGRLCGRLSLSGCFVRLDTAVLRGGLALAGNLVQFIEPGFQLRNFASIRTG